MPKKYTTIALPSKMVEYIDELVKDPKVTTYFGYSSRAELIRTAVAKHLREIEEKTESSKDKDFRIY
ncbi:MAG: ribbon-helix-helix domain-containing protein [Promethearchaeota archaeon]